MSDHYVSSVIGNDTTGDGSIGTPWATVAKFFSSVALNTAQRTLWVDNEGSYSVPSGGFVHSGAPSSTARFVFRRWDRLSSGNLTAIATGGNLLFAAAISDTTLYGLDLDAGGGALINPPSGGCDRFEINNCRAHNASLTGTYFINLRQQPVFVGCLFEDIKVTGLTYAISGREIRCLLCEFRDGDTYQFETAAIGGGNYPIVIQGCYFRLTHAASKGVYCGSGVMVNRCTFLGSSNAIGVDVVSTNYSDITNCVFAGLSSGIATDVNRRIGMVAGNLFWNNAADWNPASYVHVAINTGNTTAGADPFVDVDAEDLRLLSSYSDAGHMIAGQTLPRVSPGAFGVECGGSVVILKSGVL